MHFKNFFTVIKRGMSSNIFKGTIIILLIALMTIILFMETKDIIFHEDNKMFEFDPNIDTNGENNRGFTKQTIEYVPKEHEFEIIISQSQATSSSTTLNGIYFFDVESGQDDWITSGMWHVTDKRYYSPNHSFWYGNEVNSNYDSGNTNSGELISPEISLDSSNQPFLYIHSWYQTRSNNYFDKKIIQISLENGSWIDLKQVSHEQEKWIEEKIDLSNYRGHKIRIRFFFDTVDKNNNKYEGWYLDNITIKRG